MTNMIKNDKDDKNNDKQKMTKDNDKNDTHDDKIKKCQK